MTLAEQWNTLENGLDPNWSQASLSLSVADETRRDRAAALLAPAGPGRSGATLRLAATRGGAGVGPEAIRRLLRRLDEEGIDGTLELLATAQAAPVATRAERSLAADWDTAVADLPTDWSDVLGEVELTSSDHLERAALLAAPLNPLRAEGLASFRFRSARAFGYGASPGMVRRCLARLDEGGISGTVRVVRALSDSHPVGTQGPSWRIGDRAV